MALGGAGRTAAAGLLLLHLLLINNLCGARAQLLCVNWAPVGFVSLQPRRTVGAPRDLAAASRLCPQIKELGSWKPQLCSPTTNQRRGDPSLPTVPASGRGVGVGVGVDPEGSVDPGLARFFL